MPELNDMALIREYADRHSESAFADLVRRHIHLVYSVAFRYVGNFPDAQDVSQAVFVILAKKATGLRQRTTLTGWLYETTRLTAAAFLRARVRQQAREQEAYTQSLMNDSDTSVVWRQVAPILEEAMGRLSEKERTLLALRFFENKTAAETAALLGIQEGAAYKRAARALEKLRRFFLNRGIDSTAVTIAGAISANSIHAAPVALAKSVAAVAVTKGAAASGSTLALIKGALKLMALAQAKTAVVVGAGILLAAGTTVTIREIERKTQEDGAANGSQPIRSQTNSRSAAAAKDLCLGMGGIMATQTNYRVEYRDQVRKRTYAFFQRTDPDGVKETAKVRLDGELEVDLRNRQGRWQVRDDAVRIEFEQPDDSELQKPGKLAEEYPKEVTFKFLPEVVIEDGTACYRVEASLSPKLVSTLAERLKAAWKAARDPKFKSGADPLERVIARRQFLIGKGSSLWYGTKTYDGHGDLVDEVVVTSYERGLSIPDEVFQVPQEVPIFVARSPAELAAHKATFAGRKAAKMWDDLASEIKRANANQAAPHGK